MKRVVGAEIQGNRIVAWVYTEADQSDVRRRARELHVPDSALTIELARVWLHPYPNDPKRSEELLEEQIQKWEAEDESG